jgi:hypothetical protein
MPCIANFCIVIVLYAVYDIVFPFQQKEKNALTRAVETLDEDRSNDEKCFIPQSEPANNHPYCQASHIYELNECFCFAPQNWIFYSAFPGILFNARHQKQDATGFWNTIPKHSCDFLCNNKLKEALDPNF